MAPPTAVHYVCTCHLYQREQVFNEASMPDVTFVPPKEFPHVRASLRTRGKHVTIIGPSILAL